MTSPALRRFGDDAFDVFRALLVRPEDFGATTTEAAFGPLLREPSDAIQWADYLKGLYRFLGEAT